jgi:8-oxo-dGTP diphosphatase
MKTRHTARLIVLDPNQRLLLIRFQDSTIHKPDGTPSSEPFWATVGGEIEGGETFRQALIRELKEETGLTEDDAQISRCIWHGEHELKFGGEMVHFHEQFALARVRQCEIRMEGMTEYEHQVCRGHKWWTLPEIRTSREKIYPPNLAALVEPILRGALPVKPMRIELWAPSLLYSHPLCGVDSLVLRQTLSFLMSQPRNDRIDSN